MQGAFVRAYGVDLAEAAPREGAYRSFDELFTRPLRDGARQVHPDGLVSPADGVLTATGHMSRGGILEVKGQPYTVAELVGEVGMPHPFQKGTFAVIYLSPRDYHRVHSPADGHITRIRGVTGDLFPVNSVGERIPGVYVRNSRVAIHIETDSFGLITVVMVGAVLVGRISVRALLSKRIAGELHEFPHAVKVSKGEELGTFHLGSTVVLLIEAERRLVAGGQRVRYGESLLQAS